MSFKEYRKIYDLLIIILALISILFVILDFSNTIDLSQQPYNIIDNTILIIFSIDYFFRLFHATNKKDFFIRNIFDLIAILPFNYLFNFFRIARIFRISQISRLARLGRIVGVTGKLTNKISDFLKINGFVNVLYASLILILIASLTYSYAENVSLTKSIWWALVTATTVGYGDISPVTPLGKLSAIVLMFLGIGFIGLLTSTITEFFNRMYQQKEQENSDEKIDILIKKIESLEEEIKELKNK